MTHPTGARGFEEEVWGSRWAQPDQHGWPEAEAKHKCQAWTLPTDEPAPKALAGAGRLLRPAP
jgi:hypothetical protein